MSPETIGYEETKNKILQLIKKIKKNDSKKKENYNIILFISEEPSIELEEIELIKKIPQDLTLPFCEIQIDKIKSVDLFLTDLKNRLKKNNGVYFINSSFLDRAEEFNILNAVKNIFLNYQKSLLIIYEKKERFNELKTLFDTMSKNILFLGLPDKEARLDQLSQFIEKNNITLDLKLSTKFFLKITNSLSLSNLKTIFNNILKILNCDSEMTTEKKYINKKIFLEAYYLFIKNGQKK